MKRIVDIVFSSLALVLFSPALIVVMIILRLTGEHEVIFVQERIGRGGTPFKLYKFVTMVKGSSRLGTGMISIKDDPRVLQFGQILRRTKINELPQLVNVLKGDMSIIGPRPLPREHYEYYSDEVKNTIGSIRPGLSGVGSIIFRDEEVIMGNIKLPCNECYKYHIAPYKGRLEIWYAQHRSLWLDFKLMVVTVLVVLQPRMKVSKYIGKLPPKPELLQPEEAVQDDSQHETDIRRPVTVIKLPRQSTKAGSYTRV